MNLLMENDSLNFILITFQKIRYKFEDAVVTFIFIHKLNLTSCDFYELYSCGQAFLQFFSNHFPPPLKQ